VVEVAKAVIKVLVVATMDCLDIVLSTAGAAEVAAEAAQTPQAEKVEVHCTGQAVEVEAQRKAQLIIVSKVLAAPGVLILLVLVPLVVKLTKMARLEQAAILAVVTAVAGRQVLVPLAQAEFPAEEAEAEAVGIRQPQAVQEQLGR